MTDMVPNLRDVGGMTAADAGMVRFNAVLRSAAPSERDTATDAIRWPPSVAIDLRSAPEKEPEHPLLARGVEVVHLPLLSALRPGVTPPRDLPDLYRIMIDYAAHNLVEIVRVVAGESGSTLIHCAAGKDRTGVAVGLLLRLVGVSRDDIIDDYLETRHHFANIHRRLGVIPGHEQRRALRPANFGVSAEALAGLLDVWDAYDGGTAGWFIDAGGEPGLIDKLRQNLLVPRP